MNRLASTLLIALCLRRLALMLALVLSTHAISAFADDNTCSYLHAFGAAPLDKDADGKPIRRAIEFHWIGDWPTGFEVRCVHNGNGAGKVLCPWLIDNTSREHPDMLPRRILGCYGWKIPGYAGDWNIGRASFRIRTDENGKLNDNDDRYQRLEIDMRARKAGHVAIRLSIIPWDEKFLDPEPRLKIDEPVDADTEDRFP